jgi:hypothetical protein
VVVRTLPTATATDNQLDRLAGGPVIAGTALNAKEIQA